jgi:uncharacterized protein
LTRQAPRAPVRTCIGCRIRREQHELLRLARTPDGIRFDPDGRLPGRGTYLCPDRACIDDAARRDAGALRRALRGGSVAEAVAALRAARETVVQHQVPDGTVRSENA